MSTRVAGLKDGGEGSGGGDVLWWVMVARGSPRVRGGEAGVAGQVIFRGKPDVG